MTDRILRMYRSLTDELERLFLQIVLSEDTQKKNKLYIDYRGADAYDNRRTKGRVIGGGSEENGLEYLYLLRYSTGGNKPQKTYLFNDENGWKEEQMILAHRELLMNVLNTYVRNKDIKESQTEIVEEMFEKLSNAIQNERGEYDIQDVVNAVKECDEDLLQNRIAPDESAALEFWKLLYSYDKNGEITENEVSVEYQDDYTVFFRSIREYHDADDKKEYPVGVVVTCDDTEERFIVSRIRTCSELQDEAHQWSLDEVRGELGYDVDYRELDSISSTLRTKVRGNLCFVPHDFDSMLTRYRVHIQRQIENRISKLYRKAYLDIIDADISTVATYAVSGGISVNRTSTTDEVISLQDELNIDEGRIRTEQEKRDIGRLSSNLRAEIVEDLFVKDVCQWLYDLSRKEILGIQDDYNISNRNRVKRITDGEIASILRDIAIQNPDDLTEAEILNLINYTMEETFHDTEKNYQVSAQEYNMTIGEAGETSIRLDYDDFRTVKRVLIPEDTTIVFNGTSNDTYKMEIERGFYELKSMKRFDTSVIRG